MISFIKRWTRRRARKAEALILMYHRIGEPGRDPWGLAVRPERFAEQMEVLKRETQPMSLCRLNKELGEGALQSDTVAVTFDDGYANNLHHAKPLLERHDVPATVFVTTGMVGSKREFWWDELEGILLAPGELPQMLQLEIAGQPHQWTLREAARYFPEQSRRDRTLRAWEGRPGSRHAFYFSVWKKLKLLSPWERQKVLDDIQAWAGKFRGVRDSHRALTQDELRSLDGGPVEVGAHTVSHSSLPQHPADVQRQELRESKSWLEHFLGKTVQSFAYPYGDRSRSTTALVEEAGFELACTYSSIAGVQRQQSF